MDAATITRPIAAKDDSTVAVAPPADALNGEPPPAERIAAAAKVTPLQIVLIVLGTIAFLYFARPVVLPVFLACVAGMALKPLIRWSACCHIPPAFSAAIVLCFLVGAVGVGFFQLGRPALTWMNEAPQHMTDLRQRVQNMFPRIARFNQAAAAVNNLGATEAEKKEQQEKAPTVEVKDSRGTGSILNWTGTLLVGIGETLVLVYLLLASGDLFLQKLVRVMPTLSDKKRAIEVSHEIQQNISNYLFSVSLINIGLGIVVSAGLYFMGVPNAAMWGMLVAVLNFVPYFGPVTGVILLAAVGLLTFDTLWAGTPAARLVSAAPPAGSEPHHAGVARAPIHAQSSGHFCFLDLLDVALGCARRLIIGANPGFDQSHLRPRPRHDRPSANCSPDEPATFYHRVPMNQSAEKIVNRAGAWSRLSLLSLAGVGGFARDAGG